MSTDAASSKLIQDEVAKLRTSTDATNEARKFIQEHPDLFKNTAYLTEFAVDLEENGVLPEVDLKNTAGVPSGVLTREQLQQLAVDTTVDPLFRAFAALADQQFSNLTSADGKFRVSDAFDKLTQLQPQFACIDIAKMLTTPCLDGNTNSLFSYLDSACNGSTDGLVGYYDLDAVVSKLDTPNPDPVWQNRLAQAGISLEQLKDWRDHYDDPKYALLRESGGTGYVTLNSLKNAGYDSATGTVTVTDQTGLKISFLADGTSSTLASDGTVTITHLDLTSERHLPSGAVQYLDAQGVLQKTAANNWITSYVIGSNGLQASQLDSKDGKLTWRFDNQGWRLHDVAKLNQSLTESDPAKAAADYANSVIGDPNIYMDLLNYLPEQAADPAGTVFKSKTGSLWVTYQADGTVEEKLSGFKLSIPAGDASQEQITLKDGSVWKLQDGSFKHFDQNNKLISGERPLASAPEFDATHNTLLLKYADNSSKLINADGSVVRTLADGTVIEVSSDLKPTSLTVQGNKYAIGSDSTVQNVAMADGTQWKQSGGKWLHVDSAGTILPNSGDAPSLPFQLSNGVFIFSTGTPPVISRVIHPNGESTAFSYGNTADGASLPATQLTSVVDSTGRRIELLNDGKWHFVNADGTEYTVPGLDDFNVSLDAQGNVTVLNRLETDANQFSTDALQFTADGRTIASRNGEVRSIAYPDGTSQQFEWSGDVDGYTGFVSKFTDRSGQVWDQDQSNLGMGVSPELVMNSTSGSALRGNISVDLSGNISVTNLRPDGDYSADLKTQITAADGRIITMSHGIPEQVKFVNGNVYGVQPDQGFFAPDGSTYYFKDGAWKTADGVEPSKQADYIQLEPGGGIAIAKKVGNSLSIENYYPNGDTLQTTSPISLDTTSAKQVAQSIKDDPGKLLPELTTLSIADRLAVDAQYFALTNPPQHLIDATIRFNSLDKVKAEDLLYATGELQDGKLRDNITELHQIWVNASSSQYDQQTAQQQLVYLLGSSTARQIQQFTKEYRDRYGSDFFSAITTAPGFSDSFREALPILSLGIDGMKSGSANNAYLNDTTFEAIKNIALKYDDLQLFSLAFQYASPQQRETYKNSPDGLAKLGDHFYGDAFSDAQSYATVGTISLHRLVTKNTEFLFIDSDRILSDLVTNTSDKERTMYKLGKDLSENPNFNLVNPSDADKALAKQINDFLSQNPDVKFEDIGNFYATTFQDLQRAAWPSQQILALPGENPAQPSLLAKYEDYLINGGPTLISSIIDENKSRSGWGAERPITYYDSNAVFSKIENMSIDDWKRLKDSDYYNSLIASLHAVLKDGDNNIPFEARFVGINYTQGDDFAIAKRLIDEKRQLALKSDGTAEDNYKLSQQVGLRTTLEVFHDNPYPQTSDSIARIVSYLYAMPLTEMAKLRDPSSDYAAQVKAAIDTLPDDAKNLAMIMFNHVTSMSDADFAKISVPPSSTSPGASATQSQPVSVISIPLSPSDQLSYDTVTKASDTQLALDRALVEQERAIDALTNSNLSKPDLFTAVLTLSKADRLSLLQDLSNAAGSQLHAALLSKFSPQEQEILKHALTRLKDEDTPGAPNYLPIYDSAETMRLFTLQIVGDPASIQVLLQSLDGADGAQGDKAAKVKMVLDYDQTFHSDLFSDVLNVAGAEWKDRMVTALTIRPESWKDLVNDSVFKSVMSESGIFAFSLRNDALQGMMAQRDKLLKDVVDWETTGKIDATNFQSDLNNFQDSMASYVEAKRAFTQNALMLGLTVLTAPLAPGASLAAKFLLVGVGTVLEVIGTQLGMGRDYDFSTDAVPSIFHGAANMTMLVGGGAIAEHLLSRMIAQPVLDAIVGASNNLVGEGVMTTALVSDQVAPVISKALPSLVGAIQEGAGDAAINNLARDLAVKILGDNSSEAAIRAMTSTLVDAAKTSLNGLSVAQKALVAGASMEAAGIPSHYVASVGVSIWDNLRSNKPIDKIITEALQAGSSSILPTAAAILIGVGFSMIMDAASAAMRRVLNPAPADTTAGVTAKDGVSDVPGTSPDVAGTNGSGGGGIRISLPELEAQLMKGLQNLEMALQQAGANATNAERIARVGSELNRFLEWMDDLIMGKPMRLAYDTGTGSSPDGGPTSTSSSNNSPPPSPPKPSGGGDGPPSSSSGDNSQPPKPTNGDATTPNSTGDNPQPLKPTNGDATTTNLTGDNPQPAKPPGDDTTAPNSTDNGSQPAKPGDNPVTAPDTGAAGDKVSVATATKVPINKMSVSQLSELSAQTGVPMETLESLARAGNSASGSTDGMTGPQLEAAQKLASKPMNEMTPADLDIIAKGTNVPYETLRDIGLGIPTDAVAPTVPVASTVPVVELEPTLRNTLMSLGLKIARTLVVDPVVDLGKGALKFAVALENRAVQALVIVGIGGLIYTLVSRNHNADAPASPSGPSDSTGSPRGGIGNNPQPTATANSTLNVAEFINNSDNRKKLLLDLTSTSAAPHFYRDSNGTLHRYITSDDLTADLTDATVRQKLVNDGFDPDAVLKWLTDPSNWAQLYDQNPPSGIPGDQTVIDEQSLAAFYNRLPK